MISWDVPAVIQNKCKELKEWELGGWVTLGETVKEVSEGGETLDMKRKGKRTLQKMT